MKLLVAEGFSPIRSRICRCRPDECIINPFGMQDNPRQGTTDRREKLEPVHTWKEGVRRSTNHTPMKIITTEGPGSFHRPEPKL
jgi:hypothetical protein